MTWLGVNDGECIDPDELAQVMRPDTTLVSIMTANNETGVLQPMEENLAPLSNAGVLLHSDMVQSLGKLATKLDDVDAASFAAHKVYGPKGGDRCFGAGLLSKQPSLGDHMKTSVGPGRRTFQQSPGWQQRSRRRCGITRGAKTRKHSARSTLGSRFS